MCAAQNLLRWGLGVHTNEPARRRRRRAPGEWRFSEEATGQCRRHVRRTGPARRWELQHELRREGRCRGPQSPTGSAVAVNKVNGAGGGQGRGQTEARNPGRCPTRRTTTWCLRRQGKVSRKRNHKKRKVKYPRAEKAIVEKSGIPDNPRDSSFSRRVGRTPRRGRKARGGRGTDALLKSATG